MSDRQNLAGTGSTAVGDKTADRQTNTQLDVVALEDCVTRSIQQAELLQETLAQERIALRGADAAVLSDNAAAKRVCVQKLEELDRLRKTIDTDSLLESTANSLPNSHLHNQELSRLTRPWARFINIVRQCNEMNAGNGAVIRARQAQVKSAISLLRVGASAPDTYDLQGQNAESLGARPIAEA